MRDGRRETGDGRLSKYAKHKNTIMSNADNFLKLI